MKGIYMNKLRNSQICIEDLDWDYSVDVLIIGTGFAGLSSAIEASKNDVSVLVIEKMKGYGGNSIISDGGIAAPETHLQKKYGIEDSAEWMYEDMMTAGLGLNNPNLLSTVVHNAKAAFNWTKDELHVPYMDRVDIFGGHRVPRCYTPEGVTGTTILKKMLERLNQKNVPIRYSVSLRSFVNDCDGNVIGAEVFDDYDYKKDTGTLKTIRAKKGIVLASGGFGADVDFRSIQDPRLTSDIQTTNKPFATAEALKSAFQVGAALTQLSQIQLGAWASPDEKGFGNGPLFADYILFQYGIIVNPFTGKRFVNELGDRKQTADAILNVGHPCIGIADEKAVKHSGWDITKALSKKVVRTFHTVDELASYYKIDSYTLNESISNYNKYVCNGKDEDYSKNIVDDASPIETPLFYAMRLWPKVHYTMGGLSINTKAQVLDFDENVIEGLYAAGEVVGGVHGASRLGSCAVTECVVFGRIAGQQVTTSICNKS